MNDETQHAPRPTAAPADGATVPGHGAAPPPETIPEGSAGPFAFRPVAVPGYEILGELGRGGMGVVYKARQVKLNRVVALKMILSGGHADSRELRRFVAEGEAVASIRHPHVIQVYDVGEADGHPYMAMECLDGGSLVDRLRANGRMNPHAAAELVMKIAAGVQAAHDRGIVHRDLKPHNVLLDSPPPGAPPGAWGEPKVMDFGIAKRGASDLTQTGAIMGTPSYMAPEQARGESKAIGPAADVYSLGVMLYECLTGTVPFTGADAWSVIKQVIGDDPQPASRRAPGVPRDLDLICRKCLAKQPAERYATAAALADDLRRYLAGEAVVGARTGLWYATRKTAARWWRAAGALLVLVAVVLAAWLIPSPLNRVAAPPPPHRGEKKADPVYALLRQEVTNQAEAVRQSPPMPDRESPHPLVALPELPPVDDSRFRVLKDERIIDLRGWKPLDPENPADECSVTYFTRREMMKVAPTDELRIEGRTTGRRLVSRALRPNAETARAFAADKPGLVGGQAMKVRQLVLDVRNIPVHQDFTLRYRSTYWDSLQTAAERWVGVIGYEGSVKASMLLLFPAGRPFREYELRVAPTKQDAPVPYNGPVINVAADDKSWLYWEIANPKANYVYRVDWTW